MKASIVVGLGFGDEGKGKTTDWLCSQDPNSLVIRYSGGQQCGHTVVINGKTHIHANFGSGTLRGIPSYFTEHCSFYMNTLVEEHKVLKEKGVSPELYLNPLTIMTTPMDVAYGRVREAKLGHGSCGLGIGATQMRHAGTHKVYAVDMLHPDHLRQKLNRINDYYGNLIEPGPDYLRYRDIVKDEYYRFVDNIKNWQDYIAAIIKLDDVLFYNYNHLVFEGSQGILLDKDHGIFPNVTYANTTSRNAIDICRKLGLKYPAIYYVTRCYQTRHGNGWMSNEMEVDLINNECETCTENEWQGKFRISEVDYELINYALDVDMAYHNTKDLNMVITCLDQRPDFIFDESKIDHHMRYFGSSSPETKHVK